MRSSFGHNRRSCADYIAVTAIFLGMVVLVAAANAQPIPAAPVAAPPGLSAPHALPTQPAAAEVQVPMPSDPHLAKALDYVTVSGIEKLAVGRARFALLPITQQARRMSKETDSAFWEEFQNEAQKDLEPRLPDMIMGVAKIYAGMFSDAELDAMIAFEKSAAGRKLQTMRPAIAKAEMQFTRSWSDSIGPEIAKHVLEDLQGGRKPDRNKS
jgi:uncharacterized protein